jgi:hypothetical protein
VLIAGARGSEMAERVPIRSRGAEEGGLSSALNADKEEGGLARLPLSATPTGDTEVGDSTVVRVDNDLLQEFERLLEQHFDQYPELAASLWREIEGYLTRKIVELERRKERLRRLRDKVHAMRMLYEGDPETPWRARGSAVSLPKPEGRSNLRSRGPSRGREWK